MAKFKELKDMSIALAGAGGGGKSTLMKEWADKYQSLILQVETKSLMPAGISTHLDIIKMATTSPSEGVGFQSELINRRSKAFRECVVGFISDRAVVDSFVYYTLHNSMFSTNEIDADLWNKTRDSVLACDLTIQICPAVHRKAVPSNGIRIESIPYYKCVSSSIYSALNDIASSDGVISKSRLPISDTVAVDITISQNTAVAVLLEDGPEGFAPPEERLKAIETACNFINLIRSQ